MLFGVYFFVVYLLSRAGMAIKQLQFPVKLAYESGVGI